MNNKNTNRVTGYLKNVQKSKNIHNKRTKSSIPKSPPTIRKPNKSPLIKTPSPSSFKPNNKSIKTPSPSSFKPSISPNLPPTSITDYQDYEQSELDLEIEQFSDEDEVMVNEEDMQQQQMEEQIKMENELKENLSNNNRQLDRIYDSQVDSPPVILNLNGEITVNSEIDTQVASHLSLDSPAYNLPQNVIDYYKYKKIFSLFQWQYDALHSFEVLSGRNLVFIAPTSAGKTIVPDILLVRTIISRQKKVLYVLPYISLANEKVVNLETMLKFSQINVGGFMGNCLPAGRFPSVDIAVCTIEKANNIVNRLIEDNKLEELGMIIVDELHELSTDRGAILEQLLSKIMYHRAIHDSNIQIIGMSATLPNFRQIATWLDAEAFETDFRPIPLRELLKINDDIIEAQTGEVFRKFTDINIKIRKEPEDFNEKDYNMKPLTEHEAQTLTLALETVLDGNGVMVFCHSKGLSERLACKFSMTIKKLSSIINDPNSEAPDNVKEGSTKLNKVINKSLLDDILSQLSKCPARLDINLAKTISSSVAFHHAGLSMDERDIIEAGFKDGTIKCLFATPTLASGINLPARRVIINSVRMGIGILTKLQYQQMRGRAGRKGLDSEGESYLMCNPNIKIKVDKIERTELEICNELTDNKLESIKSHIIQMKNNQELELSESYRRLVLEVISIGLVKSFEQIKSYLNSTFFAASERTLTDEDVNLILENLSEKKDKNSQPVIQKFYHNNTETFEPSRLGSAILASSFAPDEAEKMFKEIKQAMNGLALNTDLHLLYLVIPNSNLESRNINWEIYKQFFLKIVENEDDLKNSVIRLLGLNCGYIQNQIDYKSFRMDEIKLKYIKLFYGLALNEIMNEKPLHEISKRYEIPRGDLQMLQQRTSSFCGMLHIFCKKLGYNIMSLITRQFKDRLYFGISADLIELMDIPCLNGQIARCLYDNNFKDVKSVAHSNKIELVKCLINYFLNGVQNEIGVESKVWIPIRCKSMTVDEIAELILKEARTVIEENAGGKINWSQDDTIGIRTAETTQLSPPSSVAADENRSSRRSSRSNSTSTSNSNRNRSFGNKTKCKVVHVNDRSCKIDDKPQETFFKSNDSSNDSTTNDSKLSQKSTNSTKSTSSTTTSKSTKMKIIKERKSSSSDEYSSVSSISSSKSNGKRTAPNSQFISQGKKFKSKIKNKPLDAKLSSTVIKKPSTSNSTATDDRSIIFSETNQQSSIECEFSTSRKTEEEEDDDEIIPETQEENNNQMISDKKISIDVEFKDESNESNELEQLNQLNQLNRDESNELNEQKPYQHHSQKLNSGVLTNLSADELSSQNEVSQSTTQNSQFKIINHSPEIVEQNRNMEVELFEDEEEEEEAAEEEAAEEEEELKKDVNEMNYSQLSLQSSADTSINPEKVVHNLANNHYSVSTYDKNVDDESFKIIDHIANGICENIDKGNYKHSSRDVTSANMRSFLNKLERATVFTIHIQMERSDKMTVVETDFIGNKKQITQNTKVEPEFIDRMELMLISLGNDHVKIYCLPNNQTIKSFVNGISNSFNFRNDKVTCLSFDSKLYYKYFKCCFRFTDEQLNKILWHDPKIAHWLLNSDADEPESIIDITELYLNVRNPRHFMNKIKEYKENSKRICASDQDHQRNACNELTLLYPVMSNLKHELKEKKQYEAYIRIELPVLILFANTELGGIKLDKKRLEDDSRKWRNLIIELEKKVNEYAKKLLPSTHFKNGINMRNPEHIKKLLRASGLYTKYIDHYKLKIDINRLNTSKEVLIKMIEMKPDKPAENDNLPYELPELISFIRKLFHVNDENIDFLKEVFSNSIVMGTYKHYMATGRVSMFNPNLMGLDNDFIVKFNNEEHFISLRSSFVSKMGYVLVTADYCQLELRILAALSKEKNLINVFKYDKDPFKLISAFIRQKEPEDVTQSERNTTKQIVYATIYGQGNKRLAEELGLEDENVAKRFKQEFYDAFPSLQKFVEDAKDDCKKNGFIETIFGRRRYIPEINNTDVAMQKSGERKAVNSRIQGTASDLVKFTMLKIDQKLNKEKMDASLLLQIHDELIFQVKENLVPKFIDLLVKEMTSCGSVLKTKLSIKVKTGLSWGGLTDYPLDLN